MAERIEQLHADYPGPTERLAEWRRRRDAVLEAVYEIAGVEPKY